jgi:hypothetical protein
MDDLYILFKWLNVHENIRKPTQEQEVQERGDEALKGMEKRGGRSARTKDTTGALYRTRTGDGYHIVASVVSAPMRSRWGKQICSAIQRWF